MFFRACVLALRSLRKRKLRSALCIISVAIAAFSMVFVLNVGTLGKSAVTTELEKTGLSGLLMFCEDAGTLNENCLPIIEKTRGVRQAAGVIMNPVTIREYTGEDSIVWGIDNGTEKLVSLETVQGRYFSAADLRYKRAVCMIDEIIARQLQKETSGEILGRSIALKLGTRYYDFEIIGIVKAGGGILQNFTSFLPAMVFVPRSTYTAITGQNTFTQIAVKLTTTADSDEVKLLLKRKLAEYGEVRIENLAKQKDALTNVVGIITVIVTAIGGISVLVAGFGIMTMMLMAVSERTREIGIKKALGAKKKHIVSEFLMESVTIMLLGFLAGSVPALIGVACASDLLGLTFTVPYLSVAECGGVTVLLGLFFGSYPAYKAAGLPPAQALNGE